MLRAAAFAALAASAFAAPSNDVTLTSNAKNFAVQFNGQSGSYKIFLAGNTSNTFYNVNWQSLEEVDANGNHLPGNRAMQLSSMDVTTGTGTDSNGQQYLWVRGTQTGSGVYGTPRLDILSALYVSDANLSVGNVTVIATANNLKQSVNITGWQALSPGNRLALSVKISSNFGHDNSAAPSAGTGKRSLTLPADGPVSAQLIFETTCYTGSELAPATVNMTNTGNINTFTFPAADRVWWDPEVSTVSNGNGAGAAGVSVLALAVCFIAAMLAWQ